MFITNNETFVCVNCKRNVEKHPSSSRNHCPFCLYSLHVDIDPGDRSNPCQGIMKPIGILTQGNKTQIIFECQTCGTRIKNIVAPDDNQSGIITLSTQIVDLSL